MNNVIRASDLIGLPVVSIACGDDIAEIRDVVYDAGEHRLVGFTLNKRGLFAGRMRDTLPATLVEAIGADAVMVTDESVITQADDDGDVLAESSDAAPVIGNRVISADGNDLGEVVGVILSTGDSTEAVGYEIASEDRDDNVFVPISAQMAVSEENLMVPAEATDFVRNDLAGFGAAVESYRSLSLQGDGR